MIRTVRKCKTLYVNHVQPLNNLFFSLSFANVLLGELVMFALCVCVYICVRDFKEWSVCVFELGPMMIAND